MDKFCYSNIRDQARQTRSPGGLRPFDGWALDALGMLDRAAPGILVHAFGAGPKWRQAVFLALATGVLAKPDDFLTWANGERNDDRTWANVQIELAQSLVAMPPWRIVQAALGDIPDGLTGALTKLGVQPMPRAQDYLSLIKLLTSVDPGFKRRKKALLQVTRLDADLLGAALELEEIALTSTLLERVRDPAEARRLNKRIAAIRLVCSDANDEAIRQSIVDRGEGFQPYDFVQAWLDKANRPPEICPTLDQHDDFERITPKTATNIGNRFVNCLGSKAGALVGGAWGAWIWNPGPLIATVTKCEEGNLLTGIYGPGNRRVPREHAKMLKDILRPLGVICFTRCEPDESVRVLTLGRFDNDFEEFEFD